MKVKYVEFLFPGMLFNDASLHPRDTDDPKSIEVPKGAFAFRFCERTEAQLNGEKVLGSMQYDKKTYYVGGEVFTLAEVKAGKLGSDCEILISNMECNKYDRVIRTRRGNIQVLDKDCVIV